MFSDKTKYIILIWIILLILFIFYCIFRLKYLKEKYDNTISPTYPIINYINDIGQKNKITDVTNPPQCKNLYDDNIKVQSLGYSNCESAYADYLAKGFDINNKFGNDKSLADMCPIATKSALYTQCLTSLLNKFTNGANMVDGITSDMNNSINKRLQDRTSILDNVQNQMNPLIFNKDQNDFNNYMQSSGSVAKYKEDVIGLVNNYYQDRYRGGLGYTGGNTTTEGFIASTSVYIVDPAIENLFFGKYQPISGQFLAFGDLTISLAYDTSISTNSFLPTQNSNLNSNLNSNPTLESSSKLNQIKNIILTITSNSNKLNIAYNIVNIDNYKAVPNAIKMIISTQNITRNSNDAGDSQTILQLLSTLGITAPTQLIMTYDEFTSTENIVHKTYKLVNDNLDTILVLNKL